MLKCAGCGNLRTSCSIQDISVRGTILNVAATSATAAGARPRPAPIPRRPAAPPPRRRFAAAPRAPAHPRPFFELIRGTGPSQPPTAPGGRVTAGGGAAPPEPNPCRPAAPQELRGGSLRPRAPPARFSSPDGAQPSARPRPALAGARRRGGRAPSRDDSLPPRRPAAPPAFRSGSPRPMPPPARFSSPGGARSRARNWQARDGGGARAPRRADVLQRCRPASASQRLPAPPPPPARFSSSFGARVPASPRPPPADARRRGGGGRGNC